jgi:hypothetical protein
MSRRRWSPHRRRPRKKQSQISDLTGVVGVLFLVALGIGFLTHAAGAGSDSATPRTVPAVSSRPLGASGNTHSVSTSTTTPATTTPAATNVQSTSTTNLPGTSATSVPSTSTISVPSTSTISVPSGSTTTVAPTVPARRSAAPSTSVPSGSPARQTCHAQGSGDEVLPDANCTPGATDPEITQANIDSTICRSGWTATIRPPESYTEPLKLQQMAAYGYGGQSPSGFEEDHLIPLELGGSPTSPQNLWPEAGASPNPKDAVETAANHAVCDGQMSLTTAQQEIASNWIALGQQLGVG